MEMDRKSLLIVDDDIDILQSFKDILELEGFDVDTAVTAKEGLEKAKANFYNLALLDIKLPDMEGTELLAKIHKIRPGMMKIMITGFASLENAVKSVNIGADAYIMKPVNPDQLLSAIEKKLKQQEEAERLDEDRVSDWLESRLLKLERAYASEAE
jgi:two-component system response regulator HydG